MNLQLWNCMYTSSPLGDSPTCRTSAVGVPGLLMLWLSSLQVLAGVPVCQKLFSGVSTDSQALLEDRDGHVRAAMVDEVMTAFLREQKVSCALQPMSGVLCAWYMFCAHMAKQAFVAVCAELRFEVSDFRMLEASSHPCVPLQLGLV